LRRVGDSTKGCQKKKVFQIPATKKKRCSGGGSLVGGELKNKPTRVTTEKKEGVYLLEKKGIPSPTEAPSPGVFGPVT